MHPHSHQLPGSLQVGLGEHQRRQRCLGNVAGDRVHAVVQVLPLDHLVDEADLERLLGVDHLGGEQIVGGAAPVHEHPRLDGTFTGWHAEPLQGRVREVGVLGGDDDVGGQAHVRTAAHTVAVDLRDGGLGELPQIQGWLDEEIRLRLPRVACHHGVLHERRIVDGVVADRVPGAESLAVGLQHQNLDVVVAVGIQQCGVDFFGQLLILGVGLLGPVEDDLRDRPVFLVDDSFAGLVEIHAVSYPSSMK